MFVHRRERAGCAPLNPSLSYTGFSSLAFWILRSHLRAWPFSGYLYSTVPFQILNSSCWILHEIPSFLDSRNHLRIWPFSGSFWSLSRFWSCSLKTGGLWKQVCSPKIVKLISRLLCLISRVSLRFGDYFGDLEALEPIYIQRQRRVCDVTATSLPNGSQSDSSATA